MRNFSKYIILLFYFGKWAKSWCDKDDSYGDNDKYQWIETREPRNKIRFTIVSVVNYERNAKWSAQS